MMIEECAEFIKNAVAPSSFKEIGVAALRAMYGRPVYLADGSGDGGVDAWLEYSSSIRIPVQFHAGRSVEWDRKLAEDIQKPLVKSSDAKRLYFVTAQTPRHVDVKRKIDELEAEYGIRVDVIDARDLASLVGEPAVREALGRVLGVFAPERAHRSRSAELEARLSFWLFHEASGDFRVEVARCLLATCLIRAKEPLATEALLDEALALVGGGLRLRRLFRRQLDAFREDGSVMEEGGGLRATKAFLERTSVGLALQENAEAKLREDCIKALEGKVHSFDRRQETVDAVFDDLGFLLRQSLVEKLPGGGRQEASARLNTVERRLADALKPTGGKARDALQALVDVASQSRYGRALASAELFIQLTERDAIEVTQVIAGRERMKVVLDASVAMPMLCSRYDRVAQGWVTSEIAKELNELLESRGIRMVVPHLYVEEMAAHLFAARRYRPLIGQDPDLTCSDNFFVAHYHSVAASRGEDATLEGFDELLSDLGLPDGVDDNADFHRFAHKIQKKLEDLLDRYEMKFTRAKYISGETLPDEPPRNQKVLEHDRAVAHWLDEEAKAKEEGLVLCTQDRWLLSAVAGRDWIAVDPAALVDLVQIIRPQGATGPLASVRKLASSLDEAASARAAAVWDFLAQLEGARLADRDLLRRAKEFKEAWLKRARETDQPHTRDWQRFKEGLSLQ